MNTLLTLGRLMEREERASVPDRTHVLYRRCAWHGEVLGVVPVDRPDLAGMFSDTICEACLAKIRAQPDRRAA